MKMRIAILAACAGVLTLAHADPALANYDDASEFKTSGSTAEVRPEPVIVLAAKISENNSPIPRDRSKVKRTPGQNNNDNSVGGPSLKARTGATKRGTNDIRGGGRY